MRTKRVPVERVRKSFTALQVVPVVYEKDLTTSFRRRSGSFAQGETFRALQP
jgi:hypothetical protein